MRVKTEPVAKFLFAKTYTERFHSFSQGICMTINVV